MNWTEKIAKILRDKTVRTVGGQTPVDGDIDMSAYAGVADTLTGIKTASGVSLPVTDRVATIPDSPGQNLWIKSTSVSGHISGGNLVRPDFINLVSDYIPIVAGQSYVYQQSEPVTDAYLAVTCPGWIGWTYYDSARKYITENSYYPAVSAGYETTVLTPPAGAAYIRIGGRWLDQEGAWAKFESGIVATPYMPAPEDMVDLTTLNNKIAALETRISGGRNLLKDASFTKH